MYMCMAFKMYHQLTGSNGMVPSSGRLLSWHSFWVPPEENRLHRSCEEHMTLLLYHHTTRTCTTDVYTFTTLCVMEGVLEVSRQSTDYT